MKKTLFIATAFAALITLGAFVTKKGHKTIEIGAEAPKTDLLMKDISGKELALKDLKKENGLLVIFSCNTCPFVLAWEDQFPMLEKMTGENKVGMVLVNSNQAKRDGDDSFDAMKTHAAEKSYTAHYVLDDQSALANAFGAKTTPHVFLFDKNMKLAYRGAIDDKYENRERQAKEHYLSDAITKLAAGEKIKPNDTRAKGCSIKRVKK